MGHWSTYSWIPNIRDEISQLILKEIELEKRLSCVFDDVSGTRPKDTFHPCLTDNYTSFHNDEVYYILKRIISLTSLFGNA